MSWDATLTTEEGVVLDVNYTHNCNSMIELAIERVGINTEHVESDQPWWAVLATQNGKESGLGRYSWWKLLDQRSGVEGHQLLSAIIKEMENDPATFQAMNPENGWGSYDTLLETLREMRDAVPMEEPSRWEANG